MGVPQRLWRVRLRKPGRWQEDIPTLPYAMRYCDSREDAAYALVVPSPEYEGGDQKEGEPCRICDWRYRNVCKESGERLVCDAIMTVVELLRQEITLAIGGENFVFLSLWHQGVIAYQNGPVSQYKVKISNC